MKRILLLRTGALGDSLLLWPAIAGIRRRLPDTHIDLMGQKSRLDLLVVPGGADRALDVSGTGLHLLFETDPDLTDDVRARFSGYSAVVAFTSDSDLPLLENFSACGVPEVHVFLPLPAENEELHVGEHALRSLIEVELAKPGPTPILPITPAERALGLAHLGLVASAPRLVAIAPGSGSARKNWPAERFACLAEKARAAGCSPVLVGGPADLDVLAAVEARAKLPRFTDESPKTLKGALGFAALVVGNDSGPIHLAALCGVPTIAIFGPTDPARFHPIGPEAAWLQAPSGSLEDVEVDTVWAAAVERAGLLRC